MSLPALEFRELFCSLERNEQSSKLIQNHQQIPVPSRPAKQYAAYLLGLREWSAKELAERLKLKGYAQQEIEDCLAFCQKHELQSDKRFAQSRTRMRSRTHGNRRISLELARKGVAPDIISDTVGSADNEADRIMDAAARFEGKDMTPALSAKAWRFLMSRGFSGDSIKAALKQLKAAKNV